MTKEEYEALVSGKNPEDEGKTQTESTSTEGEKGPESTTKDKIAEVGAGTKKRKAAKIVSEEHEEGITDSSKKPNRVDAKVNKKPKKKNKAVKLTFGDEEA